MGQVLAAIVAIVVAPVGMMSPGLVTIRKTCRQEEIHPMITYYPALFPGMMDQPGLLNNRANLPNENLKTSHMGMNNELEILDGHFNILRERSAMLRTKP